MPPEDDPRGKRGGVQITRTAEGVELYFPPFRMPEVALALAAFGVIAAVIPGVAVLALAPSAAANAASLLSATLIAGFVLPFLAFGVLFVALSFYMAANAL